MSAQTRGLGRGLDALIPSSPKTSQSAGDERASDSGILEVPVTAIHPNPRQPRSAIQSDSLTELVASIREHGLIQPLIVTRSHPTSKTPYQLIAGERRWRAAQLAGLASVPVLIKEATPQQSLELALVENLQRSDLNPLEEAEAYQALITEFHLSQQEVAERVGKSRVAVANTVRLLRLPHHVKALVMQGALSEGHARALLALPDEEMMLRAAEQVTARELSVRQTEELVRRLLAAGESPEVEPHDAEDDPDRVQTRQLEDEFRTALGTKVTLSRGRKGGRLVIAFYSDEELQAIYEHIVGAQ